MAETMNNIAAFIAYYAAELVLGFFILAVLTALALLIALIGANRKISSPGCRTILSL